MAVRRRRAWTARAAVVAPSAPPSRRGKGILSASPVVEKEQHAGLQN